MEDIIVKKIGNERPGFINKLIGRCGQLQCIDHGHEGRPDDWESVKTIFISSRTRNTAVLIRIIFFTSYFSDFANSFLRLS